MFQSQVYALNYVFILILLGGYVFIGWITDRDNSVEQKERVANICR